MSREFRRAMPLLPVSMVLQLTELTARQVRYYEEHRLIEPARSEGNRRMYSLNDVDALLEIRELLDQGINIAGIKKVFDVRKSSNGKPFAKHSISDSELRAILREEIEQVQITRKALSKQED